MSLAYGEFGMSEREFWRTTLASWRAMVNGFYQRRRRERFDQAWGVSYTLMAAGCKAADVTPAKLLGEKDPVDREARRELRRAIERMKLRQGPDPELLRLVSEVTRGKVGADLLRKVAPVEKESEVQDAPE